MKNRSDSDEGATPKASIWLAGIVWKTQCVLLECTKWSTLQCLCCPECSLRANVLKFILHSKLLDLMFYASSFLSLMCNIFGNVLHTVTLFCSHILAPRQRCTQTWTWPNLEYTTPLFRIKYGPVWKTHCHVLCEGRADINWCSRTCARQTSFVKNSTEVNPRWTAVFNRTWGVKSLRTGIGERG